MFKILIVLLHMSSQQVQVGVNPEPSFDNYGDCIVAAAEMVNAKRLPDGAVVAFNCVQIGDPA